MLNDLDHVDFFFATFAVVVRARLNSSFTHLINSFLVESAESSRCFETTMILLY